MLQGGVSGENRIVWLHYRSGYQWGRVDSKLQLGLLAVVYREALHEQGGEARACTTAKRMENQEALKTGTLVGLWNKVKL